MATYRVRRSLATDRDLALIADFLFETYVGFGEHPEDAFARTKARLEAIEDLMLSLAEQPHRASPRDDVLPGLRMLTRDRVVLYFDIDEVEREVRVLGAFIGGRDHRRTMLARFGRPS
jgi:plasmid stabilization system protein ParE